MGFSRQEQWSGLPGPPPGGLPHPEVEPVSLALAGGFFTTEPLGIPDSFFSSRQIPRHMLPPPKKIHLFPS